MHFLSDFEAASQGILEKVDQEDASEYGEKGAKSECKEYWDRFIMTISPLPGQKRPVLA